MLQNHLQICVRILYGPEQNKKFQFLHSDGRDPKIYLQENGEYRAQINEFRQFEQFVDDGTRALPNFQLTQILVAFIQFSV